VCRIAETLDLAVAPQTLARALSAGVEAEVLRAKLMAVAPCPRALRAPSFKQASWWAVRAGSRPEGSCGSRMRMCASC
jgi:hypothetical protein